MSSPRALIERVFGENLRGLLEQWGVDEKGEPLYRITPLGKHKCWELLREDAARGSASI